MDPSTPTVVAPVKSPFASKTNITAFLLLLFSLLNGLGVLPAALDATALVNTIVAIGSVLVMFFRTGATSILKFGAR